MRSTTLANSLFLTVATLVTGCQPEQSHIPRTRQGGQAVRENSDDVRIGASNNDAETGADAGSLPDGLLETTLGATLHIISVDGRFDGSGVLLGKQASGYLYALTAYHILRDEPIGRIDAFELAVFPHPSRSFDRRQVEVVAESERLDLALLRLPAAEESASRLTLITGESSAPERAFSIGCSNGHAPTLLSERIVGVAKIKRPNQSGSVLMWKTESPSIPGRSGGALIDESGYLLGIALGISGRQGYYCHRDEIVRFLRQNDLEMLLEPLPEGNAVEGNP